MLVPLCGKAEDLAYLASRGHEVIGVELVEDAVAAFFREHDLAPKIAELGTHRAYSYGAITIVAGDWFRVTPEVVGEVDSVYDRAAHVAMPPQMRGAYMAKMRELAGNAPGLLVTLAYDQSRFEGPPFSLDDAEVHTSYANAELLVEKPAGGRIGDANVGAVERCYAFTL